MGYDSLEHVIGKNKNVDPAGEMVQTAKSLGIVFGDEEKDVYKALGDHKLEWTNR